MLQETYIIYERHIDGRFGEQYTESILQLCHVKHRDSGEYLCSASSGMTTVTDPPIYLTVLPGVYTMLFVLYAGDSVGMHTCKIYSMAMQAISCELTTIK